MAKKSVIQTLENTSPLIIEEVVVTGNALQTNIYTADCPEPRDVIDVWWLASQAPTGACTARVNKAGVNITDAFDINVGGIRDVIRAGEVDPANFSIDPGGSLRVTLSAADGRVAGIVCVLLKARAT